MIRLGLNMLLGDKPKFLGLIFGIAFSTLLISQQVSIFTGLMARTASQIRDVTEANLWVMNPKVQYIDEIEPLRDEDLFLIRSVEGVDWASRLYKGLGVVRSQSGIMQQVVLMGVDTDTLISQPPKMIYGSWESLREPDTMIMDVAGWNFIWPNQPFEYGREIEINDRRVVIKGLCDASAPFVTFPITYVNYSKALEIVPPTRTSLSFVVARTSPGYAVSDVIHRIRAQTGLEALSRNDFMWRSIGYYMRRTGIPVNFGITVVLGVIVGIAITAQTFFLFILENIRPLATLKAMGVSNKQITTMVLGQAFYIGLVGYAIGTGLSALFFFSSRNVPALKGFVLRHEVVLGSFVLIFVIMVLSSLASIRKVLRQDPATVFRS